MLAKVNAILPFLFYIGGSLMFVAGSVIAAARMLK